ncbi:MAG TPA: MFS transporter [Actinocatenispora sp.]
MSDDETAPTTRIPSRGGPVLIGALVVDSVGNGLFMPLSMVFFTRLTDVPLALLGVLISVSNVLTLPIPVWAGSIVDRFGALPVVVGAQLLQAVGFLAYPHVTGPVGIFAAVTATGFGVRFFWSAIFTALSDYADGRRGGARKETWYAWSNMARTAGLGLGGLATGLVVADGRAATYRLVAYASAACFLVAAGTIGAFVRAPRVVHDAGTGTGGYRTLVADRPFLGLVAVNGVYALSSMMLGLALPTFVLTGLRGPGWLTSALLVGNTVLISLLGAPAVRLVVGYRRTRLLILASLLWAGWAALFATFGPGHLGWVVPAMVAATLMFTVAEAVHAPTSQALAAAVAPDRIRGRYLATFQYSFTLAGIVGPAFFGTLYGVHRSLPWLALSALNLASVGAMLALERRLPAKALRDPAPAIR